MKKKALSPVVMSILLVAIVVVLAIIIWLWASSFFEEKAQKFGKSEDQVCSEVVLDALYNVNLDITNRGNIPVYGLKIEIIEKGNSRVRDIARSINEGESITITDLDVANANKLKIIPVLLGKSKGVKKSFTCDDKYGKIIEL